MRYAFISIEGSGSQPGTVDVIDEGWRILTVSRQPFSEECRWPGAREGHTFSLAPGERVDRPVREITERNLETAIGREVPFELEWASVYTFACLRMDRFVHGRVIFAGDSAHGVSPFGARGANSGVQDADNLAWKLDLVLRGTAPRALLDSYGPEREYAAAVAAIDKSADALFARAEALDFEAAAALARVRGAAMHIGADDAARIARQLEQFASEVREAAGCSPW